MLEPGDRVVATASVRSIAEPEDTLSRVFDSLMPATKCYQKAGLVKRCLKAYAAWKNHPKVLFGIGS